MFHVLSSIRWMLKEAGDVSGRNEYLGADLLFPLLVAVLVHAHIPNVHLLLVRCTLCSVRAIYSLYSRSSLFFFFFFSFFSVFSVFSVFSLFSLFILFISFRLYILFSILALFLFPRFLISILPFLLHLNERIAVLEAQEKIL